MEFASPRCPLFATTLTRDPVLVAGTVFASQLPWLLFALVSGALVDRLNRRIVKCAANLFRAAAMALLGIAVLGGVATLPLVYIVVFLVGAAETLFDSASFALLPSLVEEPQLERANGPLSLPPFLMTELESHLATHSTHPELLFAGRGGGALRRNNFRRRAWLPAVERAGLAPLRFHDLRHTAAGLLIAQNVHPKVIQSRLGHGSIRVTLDTYGHLLPKLDARVAEGLEATHSATLSENPAAHLLHDGRS